MRIKVKTLRTLVFAGILAIGAIFAGGLITKKVSNHVAYGETEKQYCCGDIVFGDKDGTSALGTNADSYVTKENLSKICASSEQLSMNSLDYTISFSGKVYSNGSKSGFMLRFNNGSAVGTMKIVLNNGWLFDKVNVHCGLYGSDTGSSFTANGTSVTVKSKEITPYTVAFGEKTNELEIVSTKKSNGRFYISQVTFRLYK